RIFGRWDIKVHPAEESTITQITSNENLAIGDAEGAVTMNATANCTRSLSSHWFPIRADQAGGQGIPNQSNPLPARPPRFPCRSPAGLPTARVARRRGCRGQGGLTLAGARCSPGLRLLLHPSCPYPLART